MDAVNGLTILRDIGLAAHERHRIAQARDRAAQVESEQARQELWDAERGLRSANHMLEGAGFHDTGHLVGELQKDPTPA